MSEIVWQDPRPVTNARPRAKDLAAIAAQLRGNPGRWAVVYDDLLPATAASQARYIRQGARSGFRPAGAFEAQYRTTNGRARVFARYVGENGAEA